jgi:hypothetical protein
MAIVKFRVALFPGQNRIPFDMLMDAMSNVGELFVHIGRDMGLNSESSDWVTVGIKGGSMEYSQEYKIEVPEEQAALIDRGVRASWDPTNQDVEIRSRISVESRFYENKIKEIAPNGEAIIGFFKGNATEATYYINSLGNLVDRSGEKAFTAIPNKRLVRYYGELRGTISTVFVENSYIKFREYTSGLQLFCYYNEQEHGEMVEALRRAHGAIIVEGFISKDPDTNKIERIDATHFHPLQKFDFGMYCKFSESADNITGGLTSRDINERYRADA